MFQIGIAGNKFLAYLAARRSPPGGHRVLTGDVASFLRKLPCDVLPVSMKSKNRLHDLRKLPCDVLPVSMKSKNRLHDLRIHTLGQAAGTAAALAVKNGILPRNVDAKLLRNTLVKQGVNLNKDAIDLSDVRENIARRGAKISKIV